MLQAIHELMGLLSVNSLEPWPTCTALIGSTTKGMA